MVARGDSEIFFDALALADVPDLYPGRAVELLGRLLEALAGAPAPAAAQLTHQGRLPGAGIAFRQERGIAG